jgi:hypothetical protein
LSWSAGIAGALAATAVTFIIVALGSGIGLSFASPYGGPSVIATMTIAAAVWLVMAETMGFGTGGYLAGRLRSRAWRSPERAPSAGSLGAICVQPHPSSLSRPQANRFIVMRK